MAPPFIDRYYRIKYPIDLLTSRRPSREDKFLDTLIGIMVLIYIINPEHTFRKQEEP